MIGVLLIFAVFSSNLWATPPVEEIMKTIDEIEDLGVDVTVKAKMTQRKVNQGVKVIEGVFYQRNQDDVFLLVTTAPDSEKGNGYLRVNDNMWMYRRKVNG